jgi:adenosylmethionine-8-amino-7-oxononanoate aminotransferase
MTDIENGMHNIWLPYTQMQNHLPQLEIETAKDSQIFLKDGRILIDGIASWWSVAHGYQNPQIIAAMQKQIAKLSHITLAGFANDTTYQLAHKICNFTAMDYVFFSDSGSTAIEVAMKMAWQYFINIKKPQKTKFLAFNNSYHGDTTGAMSLADLSCGMHKKFQHLLIDNFNLKIPNNNNEIDDFAIFIAQNHHKIAAIFIEPMVQCAGGMKFHTAEILSSISDIAKKYEILLIIDECATGFYRTGIKFAHQYGNCVKADILVIGKALTGGMITLGATLTNSKIFNSFKGDNLDNVLMHGPTFMGNPIACSAANASLDIFNNSNYQEKIANDEKFLKEELKIITKAKNIKEVRILGLIAVIEFIKIDWLEIIILRKKAIKLGIFIRPFSNCLYLMPALNINRKDLSYLANKVMELIID